MMISIHHLIHQRGAGTSSLIASLCKAQKRSLASSANTNSNLSPSSSNKPATVRPLPRILDERTLLSQLSPLKRIVCLCPVPLGRGRVSWSGGDPVHSSMQQQQPHDHQHPHQQPPLPHKVAKYRYGERYALGVAISDPYLTHAQPIHLGGGDYDESDELKRQFVAEIVPTFRCDAHNLGPSPIFHTNLPYFCHDFLQHIGHYDIGAIVLALPMKPTKNPFCPTPTKVQLEQEHKLDQVRECLMGVLRNYVNVVEEDNDKEEENTSSSNDSNDDHGKKVVSGGDDSRNNNNGLPKRRQTPSLGPLGVQGLIDHRLSITDVLSKIDNDPHRGSWDNISQSLRQIQHMHTMGAGRMLPNNNGGGNGGASNNYYLGNREYAAHNVFSSVPPEIHAAVALNAMMEKYSSGYHNSGFF